MNVPFTLEEGLIFVPVRFTRESKSYTARFVLDTGASNTMLNTHIAVYLGYDPIASSERIQVTTASGIEYASRVIVNEIFALGKIRKQFPVLCHTLPPSASVDGLLGLDFFRNSILLIDFIKNTISFTGQTN
jgi:hypothetical protein